MEKRNAAALAAQLACPSGNDAIQTGQQMQQTNGNMISHTIRSMNITTGDTILEIGPGNGAHVAELLNKADHIAYKGIDTSESMVQQAKALSFPNIHNNTVSFDLTNGRTLDFPNEHFDHIFSINTLYFWTMPHDFCREVLRVMKGNGSFTLSFVDKSSMMQLPFAQYGFRLYDTGEALSLLAAAGFRIHHHSRHTEKTTSNSGAVVSRDFHIIAAIKAE